MQVLKNCIVWMGELESGKPVVWKFYKNITIGAAKRINTMAKRKYVRDFYNKTGSFDYPCLTWGWKASVPEDSPLVKNPNINLIRTFW